MRLCSENGESPSAEPAQLGQLVADSVDIECEGEGRKR